RRRDVHMRLSRHQEDRRYQGLGGIVILTLLIGLALTAVAVTLIARAFIVSRMQTAETLGQIGKYGFTGYAEPRETPGLRGFVDDAASAAGALFVDRLKLFQQ